MTPPTVAPQNSTASSPAPAIASAASTVVPTVSAPAAAASQSRIDSLSARIDDLQKSLDQANQELNQVMSNQSTAANQPNPVIEDRLATIEQDLNQLKNAKTSKTAQNGDQKTLNRTAVAVRHKPAIKKPARHAKKPSPGPSTEKPNAPWVLRAATSNEAWVSANSTSSDLRHVQVGDSIPGIGKVVAIHQTPAGWEVQGSEQNVH
jgi:hypothetical protein